MKVSPYLRLMRFHRPVPILLILWPTYWGLFLGARPSVKMLIVFTVGVVLMRAAGCVMNDYFDRNFDGQVARTKIRPLATKELTPRQALRLAGILFLLAASLLFFLSPQVILLSCVAFALACLYPLAKRFTHFPQFVLGLAFNFGLIMAYVQINGHLTWPAMYWYVFALLWTLIYDTEYAMVDRQDDLSIGIKSTAIFFGRHVVGFIGVLSLGLIGLSILYPILMHQATQLFPWVMLALISLFLARQYLALRQHREKMSFALFNQHHWLGLLVFLLLMGVKF